MTLHTYCDNAIRHGLVHKNGEGVLSISIHPSDSGIIIRVKDNGIGRAKAQELGTRGNGQGLKLIEQQINFYNQKNKYKMTQTITDLYDMNNVSIGTELKLFVPDEYYFE